MFKPKTLLKVVSILLIILGALGLIGLVLGFFGASVINSSSDPAVTQTIKDTVNEAYTPLNLTLGVASSLVMVLSGILGLIGKSFKAALIVMVIYTIYLIADIAINIPTLGFNPVSMINFILPILYFWGLYQSQE